MNKLHYGISSCRVQSSANVASLKASHDGTLRVAWLHSKTMNKTNSCSRKVWGISIFQVTIMHRLALDECRTF